MNAPYIEPIDHKPCPAAVSQLVQLAIAAASYDKLSRAALDAANKYVTAPELRLSSTMINVRMCLLSAAIGQTYALEVIWNPVLPKSKGHAKKRLFKLLASTHPTCLTFDSKREEVTIHDQLPDTVSYFRQLAESTHEIRSNLGTKPDLQTVLDKVNAVCNISPPLTFADITHQRDRNYPSRKNSGA